MELIKPNQISGEILTLFDEADKKVVIISPYRKIQKWYKLTQKLKSLQDRKIPIEFYVREGEQESINEVFQLGIIPKTIKNLHCKIYFNEKVAIVSSMNLLLTSEINSLDIAYKTTSKSEYIEVLEFYDRYINPKPKTNSPTVEYRNIDEDDVEIKKVIKEDGSMTFKTKRNTYTCFMWNRNKHENFIRMGGILSRKEFEYANSIIAELNNDQKFKIECIQGNGKHYDMIWGTSKSDFKTKDINDSKK